MKCPYCGYEYDDSEPKCPFCGTENTEEARKQQKAVIHTLEQEQEEIQCMPEEMFRQTNRKVAVVYGKVIGIIMFLVLLVIAGSLAFSFFRSWSTDRNLKKLETALQQKNYDRVMDLMEDIDSYDAVYDKYQEVCDIYCHMQYLHEDLEWFYESQEDPYSSDAITLYYLSGAICDCMNALADGREYLDDGLILDNETNLEEICLEAEHTLTQTLNLTEEEIQELTDMALSYYDPDSVMPYASLSLERME